MADRPNSSGEGPEFDWLYGARGRNGDRSAEKPEATRAIPVQPRTQRVQGRDQQAPSAQPQPAQPQRTQDRRAARPPAAPPLAPTPREAGSGGGRGRFVSFKTVRRIVYVLVLAWIVSLVWVGLSFPGAMSRIAWEPSGARPADQPGTNYLVVASDSRKGLSAAQRKRLHTGNDVGQRTDTIKVLHTGSGPNLLMTIPRDSYVPIPGHGSTKINAAFAYGGAKLLVKTVEQNTGLHIDGYVEIGMGGLVNLVNGVGGITICPKTDMKDPLAGLDVKKGCQHVKGVKALAYSRSRHAQQLGDLGRGEAQSEVIGQIGKRAATPGTLLNPFKLNGLKDAASGIGVGKGMSTLDIARFAWAFRSVSNGSALTCGVPISDMYIHWDDARSKKMFDYLKADRTEDIPQNLCTPSGLPKSVTG
ncbi:transcriptional attenuator, LytR family [Nocardioides terrae]|uniref:Transcriptional attenuator, LytR family n=1 Tax=Nocardioides terrae TaxID=574651 RepID=A0A1I1DMR0_9ACTN|nr:LCP family protein [Nocardioides terrae]SFB75726.1 transcriptional attenuator, LytR family [Nocardioides terrae]